ncbi:hypothetical protein CSV69_15910 [Sporosarcina sp. P26b]|nr:hypothetical protein CSV69_15910 [Sporosarcina sp. P26b]
MDTHLDVWQIKRQRQVRKVRVIIKGAISKPCSVTIKSRNIRNKHKTAIQKTNEFKKLAKVRYKIVKKDRESILQNSYKTSKSSSLLGSHNTRCYHCICDQSEAGHQVTQRQS